MNDTQVVLAVCTVPEKEARSLVDQLLSEGLVACVNMLGPALSRYRWESKIEEGQEMVLLMKTTATRKEQLRRRIAELHSYTVPEVLEFDVDSGLESYLDWVRRSCSDG